MERYVFFADLSNDSYTTVNMGVDGEGASPGGGGNGIGGGPPRGYLGATTPPYLSTSRSPSLPPQFPYPPDAGLSVYTTLGKPESKFSAIIRYVIKKASLGNISEFSDHAKSESQKSVQFSHLSLIY